MKSMMSFGSLLFGSRLRVMFFVVDPFPSWPILLDRQVSRYTLKTSDTSLKPTPRYLLEKAKRFALSATVSFPSPELTMTIVNEALELLE